MSVGTVLEVAIPLTDLGGLSTFSFFVSLYDAATGNRAAAGVPAD